MLKILRSFAVCALLLAISNAQDSNSGISLPVTLSGGALYTQRLQVADPAASPFAAGVRAALYPSVKLGSHWFAYGAIDIRLSPYLYYDAYQPEHEWYTNVIQAFIGYSIRTEKVSFVVKAGQLASAFGSFPLRYDDAQNPLLDQPLSYIQTLTLRTDQLPCGVTDLLAQHYGSIRNGCGGAPGRVAGLTSVSLYGLPGLEMDFSGHRLDARIQITNSSPINPQPVSLTGEYAQWTAGAGYSVRQGFRVGVSAFRGPYLSPILVPLLPMGATLRSFPATGIGADAQWARGRFSASGEYQHFQFDSPNLTQAPSLSSTYGELKTVITPRLFISGRAGWMNPGGAADSRGGATAQLAPNIASYELGAGSWINRHQLLKGSYEWLNIQGRPGTRLNVLGVQFVTTFQALDQPFR
ncbi:MAG TPA: hypothetical protein VKX49_27055 [Bryobacteraceae bacterium]|nr:hypothetical protein [Bryobacteraceae bacterium]